VPIYEYLCQKCGHKFEKIQKFSDRLIKKCPECGGPVEQTITAPAVQFKGTGWYVTDYANKDGRNKSSSGSKESGSSPRKPIQMKRAIPGIPIPGNPRSPKKRKTKIRKNLLGQKNRRNQKKRRNPKSSQEAGRDKNSPQLTPPSSPSSTATLQTLHRDLRGSETRPGTRPRARLLPSIPHLTRRCTQ
jgi:putative FmdB family regulatory protein